METLKNAVVRFVQDEEGAGIIEYSLIAGVMAAIVITGLYTGLGKSIASLFTKIEGELSEAAG